MKNRFKNLTIQHIQIEENAQHAEVEAQFIQDKVLIETVLRLGNTDLNQLFAKLSSKGVSISLSDDFENYSTEEGNLYMLNLIQKGWDSIEINDFFPQQEFKQILA